MQKATIAEYVELVNRYMNEGHTDGLPVIPPYREAVDAMVEAGGRPAGEVLGKVPPRNVPLTVETLAINAVMAGCLPEYMPVLLALMEAVLAPEFNLVWPSSTTKGVAPLVIINGPVRKKLNINCQGNV
ncbi:MAG TPA: TlpA family protein disulfide reductase, partial [Firmicutes bacterium]|nr:TlpA family protein disulfide reductase [Bacillota bacterium]